MKVVITEAGSSVAYHLLYLLGNGDILGNKVKRDKWPITYYICNQVNRDKWPITYCTFNQVKRDK